MNIGGLHRCSLVDYPGRPAAVVFTQGCNFRCWYCHNPELVYAPSQRFIPWPTIVEFLVRRRGLLQAVVFSGGEPTLQPDLPEVLAEVRNLGYRIKLDTNGSRPDALENLVRRRLVDFIAMDVKAPLRMYTAVAGVPVDTGAIATAVQIIRDSGIAHQFRTTYGREPGFPFAPADVFALTGDPERHIVQPFRIPTGKPILRDVRSTVADPPHPPMSDGLPPPDGGGCSRWAPHHRSADASTGQELAGDHRQTEDYAVQHHDSRA